jgi:hypothetical protein
MPQANARDAAAAMFERWPGVLHAIGIVVRGLSAWIVMQGPM